MVAPAAPSDKDGSSGNGAARPPPARAPLRPRGDKAAAGPAAGRGGGRCQKAAKEAAAAARGRRGKARKPGKQMLVLSQALFPRVARRREGDVSRFCCLYHHPPTPPRLRCPVEAPARPCAPPSRRKGLTGRREAPPPAAPAGAGPRPRQEAVGGGRASQSLLK